MDKAQELKFEVSQSEYDLRLASDKLNKLYIEFYQLPQNVSNLIEENADLEITHKISEEDIVSYRKQVEVLNEILKGNEEEILRLTKENESIKKSKQPNISKKDSQAYKNLVFNLKGLSKKLGFTIRPKGSKPDIQDNKEDVQKKDEIKNIAEKKKKREEFEKQFKELKKRSNEFNDNLEEQTKIIDDYKQYLNEVNQYINTFNEIINISIINTVRASDNNMNKKFEEINKQIDLVSKTLVDLDEIIFKIKNQFGQNIENILNEIQICFDDLDKKENQNENNYSNLLEIINQDIKEINDIFSFFEKNRNNFYDKNHNVEEEMNKLKYLHKQFAKEYKKRRPANQTIINNNVNNNNQNQNQNQDQNQNNINIKKSIFNPKKTIGQSFLFSIKDPKSKDEFYKTKNLFKENERDLLEMYLDEAQLIRKNYHVICYVYDDYEIYDIYYVLKAVGLEHMQFFSKCSHGFYYDEKIEIQSFLINGVKSKYIKKAHNIEFDINLKNTEKITVHLVYKSTKDLATLSNGEIEERKIYRYDTYGFDKSLAGQMGKFSLILRGNFDIVNFSEYFLIRNNNNVKEVEYMWGGLIPLEGKQTRIMFSKKEANWSFKHSSKFHVIGSFIKNSTYYLPIEFIGGNNEIISINPHSPQSTNLIIDEENRQYVIEYKNTRYKSAEFIIEGELRNKCKGEWLVDLTDEEVDKKMNPQDVACKAQLQSIAKKIIEDFDKKNKDSDFKFLDYMKIGMWVKENVKYDYNYIGQTQLTAMDIYKKRVGVCHHFTKLSNALLYSLGYKVLYASGYCCQKNKSFKTSTGHAWSLIKLDNNKWYPFDSTWGIFTGKIPVGHIFGSFDGKAYKIFGYDQIRFDKQEMEGNYIE